MVTVREHQIAPNYSTELYLPHSAEILGIGIQDGFPHLWVKVDTSNMVELRRFALYKNDEEIYHPRVEYIGSVLVNNEAYHVFELI